MKNNAILMFFFFLLLATPVLSFSTNLPDGTEYSPTDTITLALTTTNNPERGDAYIVEWYNSTGSLVETDIGALSFILGGTVFETYTTSADTNWTNAVVNTTANALTLQEFFNVTGSAANQLTINDASFTPIARLGGSFAVDFQVRDELNKEIDNAQCEVFGTDTTGSPLQQCTVPGGLSTTINGRGVCAGILNPITFNENEQYLAKIRCNCGIGTSACFDEDGVSVEKHRGETSFVFTVTPWLSLNTIVDQTSYEVDDTIYVCINITNNNTERIPVMINYNWRCQNGGGDASTDRILLGNKVEERGINANTTQNQCNSFLVVDDLTIEKGATNCYAATSVNVLDKNKNIVFTYDTTSPQFTLIVNEINPFVRWTRVSQSQYTGIINIDDYDVGVRDIDVRVNERLTNDFTPATMLNSWTLTYSNGSAAPYEIEVQVVATAITDNQINNLNIKKFNELSITILNVNTTLDEEFSVTININTAEEGSKMIAVTIALIFMTLLFLALGFTNKGGFSSFFGFAMALIQVIILLGIMYASSAGINFTRLLYINFIANLVILFAYGFVSMFKLSANIATVKEDELKENNKWDQNELWKNQKL